MHMLARGELMRFHCLAAALMMVMLATACSAGTSEDTGDDGAPGGTLVAAGSRWVQTRDLSREGGWTQQLEYAVRYALPSAHPQSMTMYMARFTMADPFHVDVHDLSTFDIVEPRLIEWPDTSLAHEMYGLAVSPDESHVAGVLSTVGGNYLEILALEAEGPRALLTGFRDVTGTDVVWQDDTTLLFSMDLTAVDDPAVGDISGAIVAIDLSELMAGGPEGQVETSILVGFGADDWSGVADVHSLALSPDRSRLAYTSSGDIWVKDFGEPGSGPRQVTTGPFPHRGAAFSPDGSTLAFVEYVAEYESSVFLIPVNASEPLLIDSDRPEGRNYRLDGVAASTILAWLPR